MSANGDKAESDRTVTDESQSMTEAEKEAYWTGRERERIIDLLIFQGYLRPNRWPSDKVFIDFLRNNNSAPKNSTILTLEN